MAQAWYNPFVKVLLRSPLHGIMSRSAMLLTYTGRKSGKQYKLPVGYQCQGNTYTTISFRSRNWWRNLRGGANVTVHIKGEEHAAFSEVVEDNSAVLEGISTYFSRAPQEARYFQIALDEDGKPNKQDLAREAAQRVLIRTRIASS
jgi:deazaflavin-dependent oxidoreductase (nitroreductase family)